MDKLVSVKWVFYNLPMITVKRNDERLRLTKKELKVLRDEIDEFIKFYPNSFNDANINDDESSH